MEAVAFVLNVKEQHRLSKEWGPPGSGLLGRWVAVSINEGLRQAVVELVRLDPAVRHLGDLLVSRMV